MPFFQLTISSHTACNTSIKAAFLATISVLFLTDVAGAVKLADVFKVLLNGASKEAFAAFTGHRAVVETGGIVTTYHTELRSIC